VYAEGKKMVPMRHLNLKGTARSLDNAFGRASLGDGIISRAGVVELRDDSLLINIGGTFSERPAKTSDRYFFAHGYDYRRTVRDFYKITGKVPLLPQFTLRNW